MNILAQALNAPPEDGIAVMCSPARSSGDAPQLAGCSAGPQPSSKRNLPSDAEQPSVPKKARNCMTHGVAKHAERDVRDFWHQRGKEEETLQSKEESSAEKMRRPEETDMRSLFCKTKQTPQEDIWTHGASQPAEEQTVEAAVSNVFALERLKEVVELRETWLQQQHLPTDFQMRDGLEKVKFLKWAKDKYHAEDYQQSCQQKDYDAGGNNKFRSGKNSRWNRELQRRLGTPVLWYLVLDGN